MRSRNAFKAYLSAYHNEVTGSRLLIMVEFPDGISRKILVDCGYFQEIKYRYLNYVDDLSPEHIDAMIITHNHIDHTGLIPKFVKNGYRNKIYMTNITEELCPAFLYDCCEQQEENANDMKVRDPQQADKYKPLFFGEDVEKALKLIVGLPYRKTLEIFPGIKLTFFENGHILGASMVLLQCYYQGMQSINFFFTGDYRPKNCFYDVPPIPKWLRDMPLIMIHESTYGDTDSEEIKVCLKENLLEAFSEHMDILIGAFAQGRMQELLYFFKCMQDDGELPEEYLICVDGPLGIKTTGKYKSILSWFNPEKEDFLPNGVVFLSAADRKNVFAVKRPKIVLTTSGMLSNGPARQYVPIFLKRKNAMIHLAGYAAEETLARKLLETKNEETIELGGQVIKKKAVVKTTRELTSHATADQMIDFIKQFNNILFLGINHGDIVSQETFADRVVEETSIENVGFINRENMYVIYQNATSGMHYNDVFIKRLPAKLQCQMVSTREKEVEKKKRRQLQKAEEKRRKNALKRLKRATQR